MKRILPILYIASVLLVVQGCKNNKEIVDDGDLPFRKVLKTTDLEIKYKYATRYFKEEECLKAMQLYEELIPAFRLTKRGEEVYYRYAQTHYCLQDYYLAGYYFKSFVKRNPNSDRIEDALFMSALCHVRTSPVYSLDQTETLEAIEQLQFFLDKFPGSEKKDTCNLLIDKLNNKLELKQYKISKLYYKTENYQAATVALKTMLEKFPGTKYREELMFLRFKAGYYLANNSVESKKIERFEESLNYYSNFVSAFPESSYRKEVEEFYLDAQGELTRLKRIKQKEEDGI